MGENSFMRLKIYKLWKNTPTFSTFDGYGVWSSIHLRIRILRLATVVNLLSLHWRRQEKKVNELYKLCGPWFCVTIQTWQTFLNMQVS